MCIYFFLSVSTLPWTMVDEVESRVLKDQPKSMTTGQILRLNIFNWMQNDKHFYIQFDQTFLYVFTVFLFCENSEKNAKFMDKQKMRLHNGYINVVIVSLPEKQISLNEHNS